YGRVWHVVYRIDPFRGVVAKDVRRHRGARRRHDSEERSAIDAAHARLPESCIVRRARGERQHGECRRTGTTSSPTIYARALLAQHRARSMCGPVWPAERRDFWLAAL